MNNLRSYIKHSTQFSYQICRHFENILIEHPPPLFFLCDDWTSGSSRSKAEYHYPPDISLSSETN